MVNVVKNGTGNLPPLRALRWQGKPVQPEVSDNKETKPHAWFYWLYQDEYPCAIVVMIEKRGRRVAARAANCGSLLKKPWSCSNRMNDRIEAIIKNTASHPGVYLMKDKDGNVYVQQGHAAEKIGCANTFIIPIKPHKQ